MNATRQTIPRKSPTTCSAMILHLTFIFFAAADRDDLAFKDSNSFSFLGIFRLSHIFRRRGDDKSVKTQWRESLIQNLKTIFITDILQYLIYN